MEVLEAEKGGPVLAISLDFGDGYLSTFTGYRLFGIRGWWWICAVRTSLSYVWIFSFPMGGNCCEYFLLGLSILTFFFFGGNVMTVGRGLGIWCFYFLSK